MISKLIKELQKFGFQFSVDFSGIDHVTFEKQDDNFIYNININPLRKEITFWKMHKDLRHPDYGRAIAYSADYDLVKTVVDNYEAVCQAIEKINEYRLKQRNEKE